MTARQTIATGLAVMTLAAVVHGQVTTKKENVPGAASTDVTAKLTGEVVWIQGDWLAAKMQPNGRISIFNVQPGREFMIDGQPKRIGDLKVGTVLSATVVTTTQPVTVRTTSSLNGTVWYVSGNYVILTLANGENKAYNVPESVRFMVEGKPASVGELRQGMKVSVTKIVEEPHTEMSTTTTITGKAPK
jgi:hypothetical protein